MINATVGSGTYSEARISPFYLGLLVAIWPASSKPTSRDKAAKYFKGGTI